MDEHTEGAILLYYEAIRRLHPSWEDKKCRTIARMAFMKAFYGVSYTIELERILATSNKEIMNST